VNTASFIHEAGSAGRTRVLTERPKDDAGELSVSPGENKNLPEASNQKPKNNPINKSCISVRETTPMKRLIASLLSGYKSHNISWL
jgi:hypothetical protein